MKTAAKTLLERAIVAILLCGCAGLDEEEGGPPAVVGGGAADTDRDGFATPEDCDDTAAAVHPGALEVCDGIDNDCDGLADDADDSVSDAVTRHVDADGDGYGDANAPVVACEPGEGEVADATDYDDADPLVWREPDTHNGNLVGAFSTFCSPGRTRTLRGDVSLMTATQADVDSLWCLSAVTGDLIIYGNDALTDLHGLSRLTQVGDVLEISFSDGLPSLTGLERLESVGGYFHLARNSAMVSVDGLSGLREVGSFFNIYDNDALVDTEGLSSLTSVGGRLDIAHNGSLPDLDGLRTLATVGDSLVVSENAALRDLDGLSGLTSIGDYLGIQDNPALCQSSIDALLLQLANFGFAGSTTITGNDAGC